MMIVEPKTVFCVCIAQETGVGVAGVVFPPFHRAMLVARTQCDAAPAAGGLTCRVFPPAAPAPDGLSDHARGVRAERARVLLELRRRIHACRRRTARGLMDSTTAHDRRGQAASLADWLRHGLHWLADDQRAAEAASKEDANED